MKSKRKGARAVQTKELSKNWNNLSMTKRGSSMTTNADKPHFKVKLGPSRTNWKENATKVSLMRPPSRNSKTF